MTLTISRSPYSAFTTRKGRTVTPQSQAMFGENQVQNNAGGFVYTLDPWKRLDRFLILGTEGNTYYQAEKPRTLENAKHVLELIKQDGVRVVNRVLEISESNRAPKADPGLFVLALAISFGNTVTKKRVVEVLPRVARIGTHLFMFVEYTTKHRGWGRVLREAVANWYTRHALA